MFGLNAIIYFVDYIRTCGISCNGGIDHSLMSEKRLLEKLSTYIFSAPSKEGGLPFLPFPLKKILLSVVAYVATDLNRQSYTCEA